MQRRTLIAVLGAVVVGGTGGTVTALALARHRRAQLAAASPDAGIASDAGIPPDAGPPPSDAGPPGTTPDASPAPATPEAHALLTAQMRNVLDRFALWSHEHPGAPCPDLLALGIPTLDPWGHDLQLTCTDQPANQRVGAISAGPDGLTGTDDDIPSWTLGPAITSLARGPRWQPAIAPARPSAPPPARPTSPHRRTPPPSPPLSPMSVPAAPAPQLPKPEPTPRSEPPPDNDDIPSRRSPR